MRLYEAWRVLVEGAEGDRGVAGGVLLEAVQRSGGIARRVLGLSGDDDLVEEAGQRVLLTLLRPSERTLREAGERLEDNDALAGAYLNRAVLNRCRDLLRQRNRERGRLVSSTAGEEPGVTVPILENLSDGISTEDRLERQRINRAVVALDDTLLSEYRSTRDGVRRGSGTRACETLAQLDELSSSGLTAEDLARRELGADPTAAELTRKSNALYQRFHRAREELLRFLDGRPPDEAVPADVLRLCGRVAQERYLLKRRSSR